MKSSDISGCVSRQTEGRNEPASVARPRRRTPRRVADPNRIMPLAAAGCSQHAESMARPHAASGTKAANPAEGGTGKVLVVLVGPLTTFDSCGRKQTNRRFTAIYTRPNRDIDLPAGVGQVVSRPGQSRGSRLPGCAMTFRSQARGLGRVAAVIAATTAGLARRASRADRSCDAIRIPRTRRNASGNSPYVFRRTVHQC